MSLVLDTPRAVSAISAPLSSAAIVSPGTANVSDEIHRLAQLERAVAVALSPLDYADATAWGDALTAALCAVADADGGVVLLPGRPLPWRSIVRNPHSPFGLCTPVSTPAHDELTERLLTGATGDLVLWARDDLADATAHPASPSSRDTIGIRVRTDRGAVAAVCVHRNSACGPTPVHLLATLRAIAPAFRAGVAAWVSASSARMNVARMLDSLADAALLFDASGTLVHANPSAERLTSAPDAARIRTEAQKIGWALSATAQRRAHSIRGLGRGPSDAVAATSPNHTVPVGAMIYELRGTIVGEQLVGGAPAVLVTIAAATVKPLTDDVLHAEYGLTARETQVARLMAEGLSNSEIADRLGVRFFTARNHVERTLAKLGVASRQRVGPLLRNEPVEQTPRGRSAA